MSVGTKTMNCAPCESFAKDSGHVKTQKLCTANAYSII